MFKTIALLAEFLGEGVEFQASMNLDSFNGISSGNSTNFRLLNQVLRLTKEQPEYSYSYQSS